jgi:hypothetical protein
MIYSIRGAAFMMVVVAGLGAYSVVDRTANYQPTKARISTIDRNCDIVETTYDANYKRKLARTYTDSCNSIDEWDKVKDHRKKDVSGKAVVHLDYTAPRTGESETGELRFDGHDDEFYALKAGDEVDILVSNSDPKKIRKA